MKLDLHDRQAGFGTPGIKADAPLPDGRDIAATLLACLRADGHLSNVLWHISHSWAAIESALVRILAPEADAGRLGPLEINLLRLIVDGEGVTGRRMRPFVEQALSAIAGPEGARRAMEHCAIVRVLAKDQ